MACPHVSGVIAAMYSRGGATDVNSAIDLMRNGDYGVWNKITWPYDGTPNLFLQMPCYTCDMEWVAVSADECPANADINECTSTMNSGTLCEADTTLPDGNDNYDVNNCGDFDIFRAQCISELLE